MKTIELLIAAVIACPLLLVVAAWAAWEAWKFIKRHR